MKTPFTVAVVAATFAITCGIFGIAAPAQAQTNSSDTPEPSDMPSYPGGDVMMRNMLHERGTSHKW